MAKIRWEALNEDPMPTYKRNFLDKVIFRIDFEEVGLEGLKKIEGEIERQFPDKRQKTAGHIEVRFDFQGGGSEQSKREVTVLNYLSKSGHKMLEIAPSWAFIEYRHDYTDSKELLADITLLERFIDVCSIEVINRVGLRYINIVNLEEKSPLNWTKYFNKQLIGPLDFSRNQKLKSARIMSQIVSKYDDADLVLNYGLWNKDFPNEVVSKEFLMDFDCSTKLPVESSDFDVVATAKTFNQRIETLFEVSITQGFRNLLNKKKS